MYIATFKFYEQQQIKQNVMVNLRQSFKQKLSVSLKKAKDKVCVVTFIYIMDTQLDCSLIAG
jgi:hypothetical protein